MPNSLVSWRPGPPPSGSCCQTRSLGHTVRSGDNNNVVAAIVGTHWWEPLRPRLFCALSRFAGLFQKRVSTNAASASAFPLQPTRALGAEQMRVHNNKQTQRSCSLLLFAFCVAAIAASAHRLLSVSLFVSSQKRCNRTRAEWAKITYSL